MCVYIYIYIERERCVYIHIYIYIYVYIYIYIYIHAHVPGTAAGPSVLPASAAATIMRSSKDKESINNNNML